MWPSSAILSRPSQTPATSGRVTQRYPTMRISYYALTCKDRQCLYVYDSGHIQLIFLLWPKYPNCSHGGGGNSLSYFMLSLPLKLPLHHVPLSHAHFILLVLLLYYIPCWSQCLSSLSLHQLDTRVGLVHQQAHSTYATSGKNLPE